MCGACVSFAIFFLFNLNHQNILLLCWSSVVWKHFSFQLLIFSNQKIIIYSDISKTWTFLFFRDVSWDFFRFLLCFKDYVNRTFSSFRRSSRLEMVIICCWSSFSFCLSSSAWGTSSNTADRVLRWSKGFFHKHSGKCNQFKFRTVHIFVFEGNCNEASYIFLVFSWGR